jgi:hypothetical protein
VSIAAQEACRSRVAKRGEQLRARELQMAEGADPVARIDGAPSRLSAAIAVGEGVLREAALRGTGETTSRRQMSGRAGVEIVRCRRRLSQEQR